MNTPTPTVTPETELNCRLQAQEWNFIMQTLNDTPLPYRVSSSLIPKMLEQLQGQVPGPSPAQEAGVDKPAEPSNGVDKHPPASFVPSMLPVAEGGR